MAGFSLGLLASLLACTAHPLSLPDLGFPEYVAFCKSMF
jgi:hypothetical protein